MGIARLGALVNFISHTVIVGFTAGAGLLIIAAQLPNFFGVRGPAAPASSRACVRFVRQPRQHRPVDHGDRRRDAGGRGHRQADAAPRALHDRRDGRGQRLRVRARAIRLRQRADGGCAARRACRRLSAPSLDPDVWRKLVPAALALTVLGLTEAVSIARAIALRVGTAHRRQPGIHRPGTVEHRRRVHVVVSVVGLVQPQRRQLRGRRAHAAGVRARGTDADRDPVRGGAARARTCRSR